jgi:uncharacterized protein (TIGR03083 family)
MAPAVHTCHTRDHAEYIALAADEIERFATLVDGADPDATVPTCPEWQVRDLVEHLGSIHRWAAHMVAIRSPKRASFRDIELATPASTDEYGAWIRAGRGVFVDACKGADPDAGMWAWGADQHVRFWSRRMLLETAIHRADLAFACGADPASGAATAVDGIDELLDNLPSASYFAPNVDRLRGDGETLRFEAADADTSWRVTLEPDRYLWDHDGTGADVVVRGRVPELFLLLYRRRSVEDAGVSVEGDATLFDRWLADASL